MFRIVSHLENDRFCCPAVLRPRRRRQRGGGIGAGRQSSAGMAEQVCGVRVYGRVRNYGWLCRVDVVDSAMAETDDPWHCHRHSFNDDHYDNKLLYKIN
jgi:hypothetical protein